MASLRAWLIFSNVNNHRADDEISWFAAVHRWSLSQMATASTWTSTTSSPSSQISEYTRGNLKRKAWSKHLNQRSFQKTPLCHPCAWSPRCLSSWARCRHQARIPGSRLPVAGTPHPVNWKVKTEETEPDCVFFYQMKECVRSYHCSAAPRMRDASPPIMVGRTEVSVCLDTRKISAQI